MKSSFAGLAVMTLAALTGCSQGTPGGPGTANKNPSYGQADDTFNLSVPVMSSNLQQGEQTEATVGIKRATNFDEDVVLEFADVPKGVTVEPASPVIKRGESDAKVTFRAGDEASLGHFKVKVTGHPTKGGDAQIEFKLTIAAKDKEAEEAMHDGKIVSITGDKLVMMSTQGQEHSHTLTADARLTLDGNVCEAADLKPGTRIRVTTHGADKSVANRIEGLDKNPDFASL
jgi:hypothetical protein